MAVTGAACTRTLPGIRAIGTCAASLRHRQPLNCRLCAGPSPRPAAAAEQAAVSARRARQLCVTVLARRSREEYQRDDDFVAFDDEEEWEKAGTTVQGPGVGLVFQTALRGLSAISERITSLAVQLTPEDVSPAVVKIAVNSALVLLALSFVKSVLSFFLTLGTIVLGAYVAVKVFGVDVAGVTGSLGGGGDGASSGKNGGSSRPKVGGKRRPDSRAPQSEFKGLLGRGASKDEDGLLDVWFERKGGSSGKSSGKSGGKPEKRGR